MKLKEFCQCLNWGSVIMATKFAVFAKQTKISKTMIGDSLTFKNLLAIKQAMNKIKPIDQSEFF